MRIAICSSEPLPIRSRLPKSCRGCLFSTLFSKRSCITRKTCAARVCQRTTASIPTLFPFPPSVIHCGQYPFPLPTRSHLSPPIIGRSSPQVTSPPSVHSTESRRDCYQESAIHHLPYRSAQGSLTHQFCVVHIRRATSSA